MKKLAAIALAVIVVNWFVTSAGEPGQASEIRKRVGTAFSQLYAAAEEIWMIADRCIDDFLESREQAGARSEETADGESCA